MGTYNVHAGHNPEGAIACGASGILNESRENRLIKEGILSHLRNAGHKAYDCTCNNGTGQNDVLKKIVAMCNSHAVDLDVSIHLNAGGGQGVEVWCYDAQTSAVAQRICDKVAALGFPNRGVKYTRDLYVLRSTKSPAILVECCFVDSVEDAQRYHAHEMAGAIASGLLGAPIQGAVTPVPTPQPSSGSIDVVYQVYSGKWYPNVQNTEDFAGVRGKAISGIYANTVGDASVAGNLKMRAHVKNKNWLPWVIDRKDFAGILGASIDVVQMELINCPGHKVQYRVSPLKGDYYPWVTNTEDQGGYAGSLGKEIDRLQIRIL
ncbi:MAG: N-acetylmuramoyl-L-alanine amidase [Lachnospiraceae bacterium]